MFLDYTKVDQCFIVCGMTDLRKGIDGLASIVQHDYELDIYQNTLFLFCGGRKDRFKMLYYDQDGFLLLYKRLDHGKNGPEKTRSPAAYPPTNSVAIRRLKYRTTQSNSGRKTRDILSVSAQ